MDKLDQVEDFEVGSIYGMKTKQGLVQFTWKGTSSQLSVLEAKKVAYMILEAAEAAATDQALIQFFEQLKMPMEQLAVILKLFRDSRGRNDPRFFED